MAAQPLSSDALSLLADLATIRSAVLEKAPFCLPEIAEALDSAEEKAKAIKEQQSE